MGMKTLLLLRHGEAADPQGPGMDFQRKLTRQGLQDMQRLRDILVERGLMPQFAMASDAHRTQLTLREVTGEDYRGQVVFESALYNAEYKKIIETARQLNDRHDVALIVAHNPGIHMAAMNLVSDASDQALQTSLMQNYSSGTLTVLECPIERWEDLAERHNRLLDLIVPGR